MCISCVALCIWLSVHKSIGDEIYSRCNLRDKMQQFHDFSENDFECLKHIYTDRLDISKSRF